MSALAIRYYANPRGLRIPGVEVDGRPRWLVSRHDPQREATRNAQMLRDSFASPPVCIVVLGWGLGFLPEELADSSTLVLVFEPAELNGDAGEEGQRNRNQQEKNIYKILFDKDDSEASLALQLRAWHEVLIFGGIELVGNAGYAAALPGVLDKLRAALGVYLERAGQDFAVQASFGSRWLRNGLRNLAQWEERFSDGLSPLEVSRLLPEATRTAAVRAAWALGAGPSLWSGLEQAPSDAFFVAADTAAPICLAAGREPDIVCSLDAQWYTTLHLRGHSGQSGLWLCDSLLDPTAIRSIARVLPVFGRHPLNRVLVQAGLDEELISEVPSNAGRFALAISLSLAKQDTQHGTHFDGKNSRTSGLDFSYPGYRSYARGSYRDAWDGARSSRFSPLDSLDMNLMARGEIQQIETVEGAYSHSGLAQMRDYPLQSAELPLIARAAEQNWKLIARETRGRLLARWTAKIPGRATWHRFPELAALIPSALAIIRRSRMQGNAPPAIEEALSVACKEESLLAKKLFAE